MSFPEVKEIDDLWWTHQELRELKWSFFDKAKTILQLSKKDDFERLCNKSRITDKEMLRIVGYANTHRVIIDLPNLRKLSDRQSEILSTYKWWNLCLYVTNISSVQAQNLSRCRCDSLNFKGLKVTWDCAEWLSKFRWHLTFRSSVLLDESAEYLSKFESNFITIFSESGFSDEQIKYLSDSSVAFLFLVTHEFSDEQVRLLSDYRGKLRFWAKKITTKQLVMLMESHCNFELWNPDLTYEQEEMVKKYKNWETVFYINDDWERVQIN